MAELPSAEALAAWLDLEAAVTVCDREGTILWMNPLSEEQFANRGGKALIGQSLFACHNERSCEMIRVMMENDGDNTYILQKSGRRRLIWQACWHRRAPDGSRTVGGMVEISFPVDEDIRVVDRG